VTTIIGIEHPDRVEMMADSQISYHNRSYSHDDIEKICKRGDYLFGICGHFVAMQTIQNFWDPPKVPKKLKGSLYSFVISQVIPSLKDLIGDHSLSFNQEDQDSFCILLAVKGQLFEIDQDFSVSRNNENRYAIGTGADFALGALDAGSSIKEAMTIAASLDIFTAEPFIYEWQEI